MQRRNMIAKSHWVSAVYSQCITIKWPRSRSLTSEMARRPVGANAESQMKVRLTRADTTEMSVGTAAAKKHITKSSTPRMARFWLVRMVVTQPQKAIKMASNAGSHTPRACGKTKTTKQAPTFPRVKSRTTRTVFTRPAARLRTAARCTATMAAPVISRAISRSFTKSWGKDQIPMAAKWWQTVIASRGKLRRPQSTTLCKAPGVLQSHVPAPFPSMCEMAKEAAITIQIPTHIAPKKLAMGALTSHALAMPTSGS
mmetsp:Transcript_138074/g.385193  ORF Transcript_138074/g.385193 Transcript_138074/m.385193 type:complete len:256 (-) Transcript_138074:666-1433(-)